MTAAPTDAYAVRPAREEHHPYFSVYIDRVPDGPVLETLARQHDRFAERWAALDEATALRRYAAGKWSVKEVLGHLVDSERVFGFRALAFARSDPAELPGFAEDDYVAAAGFDARGLDDILREYAAVRASTLALFAGLDAERLGRSGVANGARTTARSVAWIVAGHELHHAAVLEERYLA